MSLTDRVLEFEGPETFVAGLVEKFTGVIQAVRAGAPLDATDAAGGDTTGRNGAGECGTVTRLVQVADPTSACAAARMCRSRCRTQLHHPSR